MIEKARYNNFICLYGGANQTASQCKYGTLSTKIVKIDPVEYEEVHTPTYTKQSDSSHHGCSWNAISKIK